MSSKDTERRAEAGVEPTVDSVGESYDIPVLGVSIGFGRDHQWPLHGRGVYQRGSWRSFDALECATFE